MAEIIEITDGFQFYVTPTNGTNLVCVFDSSEIWRKFVKPMQRDYHVSCKVLLETFDIASRIISLADAPFPNTSLTNSRNEDATEIHKIWANYPRIELQILCSINNGNFFPRSQPIVLQNYPFSLPIPCLRPYLSSGEVRLMGENQKIAVQVVPTGADFLRKQLSGQDSILISGEWSAKITAIPKINQEIGGWMPIAQLLEPETPKKILPYNPHRKFLILQNQHPTEKIYLTFGSESNLTEKPLVLNPNGSTFTLSPEKGVVISSEIWAIAENAATLNGMEGSLNAI